MYAVRKASLESFLKVAGLEGAGVLTRRDRHQPSPSPPGGSRLGSFRGQGPRALLGAAMASVFQKLESPEQPSPLCPPRATCRALRVVPACVYIPRLAAR